MNIFVFLCRIDTIMNNTIGLKYDYDIFNDSVDVSISQENVNIRKMQYHDLEHHINSNIYIKSTLFILVHSGNAEIEINFRGYEVKEGQMILLSFGHFFRITKMSLDIHCTSLYIQQDFIADMYSSEMLYKRVKYGVKMFERPILSLSKEDFNLMQHRMQSIDFENNRKQHIHHRKIVLDFLHIYLLDLSNIIENTYLNNNDEKPSREEIYFEQFLTLLVQHYKIEHNVDFYAQNIHITSQYLTKIAKKLSGQSVSDFIFQLIYSDSQQLLKQPQLSIQQIALELNFSDQSAFGKFFKRKSGHSPKDYRNIKK